MSRSQVRKSPSPRSGCATSPMSKARKVSSDQSTNPNPSPAKNSAFSMVSILSARSEQQRPDVLAKPIPMLPNTPTTSTTATTNPLSAFPCYYSTFTMPSVGCPIQPTSSINSSSPTSPTAAFPNPMAFAAAMSTLQQQQQQHGSTLDPTTLIMLQSLINANPMLYPAFGSLPKQADTSPPTTNEHPTRNATSNSSSPQCTAGLGFPTWLTPSTENSSTSSNG